MLTLESTLHKFDKEYNYYTRNTHSQRASRQYYYTHTHKCITQLCARMSINNIPDRDGHVHTYVHHENRSLIHSLALMHSAVMRE